MKKGICVILLLSFFITWTGCTESSSSMTSTTTTDTTTTGYTATISTYLDMGFYLNELDDIMTWLHERYQFDGNVYYLFSFDFPEDVTYRYGTSDYYDHLIMREATIQSDGFDGQTLFEYIVSDLQTYCTEISWGGDVDGTTHYRDDDGNIIEVSHLSETSVRLMIERLPSVHSIRDDSGEVVDAYFTFPSGDVAKSIEALRTKIIDGCLSCSLSDITDRHFTYTYMGHTFLLDEDEATYLEAEGNYHFKVIPVDDE